MPETLLKALLEVEDVVSLLEARPLQLQLSSSLLEQRQIAHIKFIWVILRPFVDCVDVAFL
jgi:hypothetical protein